MKNKPIPITTLRGLTEVLDESLQSKIIGGDCVPMMDPKTLTNNVLSKLFNNGSGLTPSQLEAFTTVISQMSSNQLGQDVLQALLSSNAPETPLINNSPIGGAAFDGKNLNVFFPDYPTPAGYLFTNVVHEIFHMYQQYVGNNTGATYEREIEAFLFTAMMDQAMDNANPNVNTDTSYFLNSGDITRSGTDAASTNFRDAFNDILNNKDFSVDNMNKLIDNFYNGANISQTAYSPDGPSHYKPGDVTDLSKVTLGAVFPCFEHFLYHVPPPPGGGGGGGGGGSNEDGSFYFSYSQSKSGSKSSPPPPPSPPSPPPPPTPSPSPPPYASSPSASGSRSRV
ncbi:hypothetical protein [Mucilaginibacter jinjuensis]|uniref:Uncharacterized protein n=1 Tax=Mucilaginibacter jinjuensis TaxID=1176721 RepID=A0ABY7TD68_9SPHI|nr:hypothetical protein [Mucilaginibacter jinjuensis]WCT14401.1 hypothetical protein PQO05_10700 [Mucilaginibacter jinjuensis]